MGKDPEWCWDPFHNFISWPLIPGSQWQQRHTHDESTVHPIQEYAIAAFTEEKLLRERTWQGSIRKWFCFFSLYNQKSAALERWLKCQQETETNLLQMWLTCYWSLFSGCALAGWPRLRPPQAQARIFPYFSIFFQLSSIYTEGSFPGVFSCVCINLMPRRTSVLE